jgi:hypothetical protein
VEGVTAAEDMINNRAGATVVVEAAGDMISSKEAAMDSNKAEATEEEDMTSNKAVAMEDNRVEAMEASRVVMDSTKAEATDNNKEVAMDSSKEMAMGKEVKADTATTATEEAVVAGATPLKTALTKDTAVEVEETNSRRVEDRATALEATLIPSKLLNTPNNMAAEIATSFRLHCRSSATRASITSPTRMSNSSWAHIKRCMAADKGVGKLILLILLGLGQRCRH